MSNIKGKNSIFCMFKLKWISFRLNILVFLNHYVFIASSSMMQYRLYDVMNHIKKEAFASLSLKSFSNEIDCLIVHIDHNKDQRFEVEYFYILQM